MKILVSFIRNKNVRLQASVCHELQKRGSLHLEPCSVGGVVVHRVRASRSTLLLPFFFHRKVLVQESTELRLQTEIFIFIVAEDVRGQRSLDELDHVQHFWDCVLVLIRAHFLPPGEVLIGVLVAELGAVGRDLWEPPSQVYHAERKAPVGTVISSSGSERGAVPQVQSALLRARFYLALRRRLAQQIHFQVFERLGGCGVRWCGGGGICVGCAEILFILSSW
mmetsp:Transcript_3720/g.9028  ORF Transcript_3720/g.9028 Transcript_3720/m.9028 type:complete len:223 (+) Transcript_3720:958-1626(+)